MTPGNLIFTPRGATHSFTNIGASPARLLEWTIPAATSPTLARSFKNSGADIDPKRLAEINHQFATEFIELPQS